MWMLPVLLEHWALLIIIHFISVFNRKSFSKKPAQDGQEMGIDLTPGKVKWYQNFTNFFYGLSLVTAYFLCFI